ncbi:MAG: L-2-hydroxyglutarate oxidase, partial [Planctomycetota bacterium]
FAGFRRLASRHVRMGLGEIHRSLSKSAFVAALRRLLPSLKKKHLKRGRSGVRAQAVLDSGELMDDFSIQRQDRITHVLNAPSPAATASLAIADRIIEQASS